MKLERLCFVLPPESLDIGKFDDRNKHCDDSCSENKKKQVLYLKDHSGQSPKPKTGCGNQVVALVHDLFSGILDSKWIKLCRGNGSQLRKDWHHHSGRFTDADGVQLSYEVVKENPRIFSFAELYIGTRGFSEDEVLGSGGFGKVYRAVLPSDGSVAAVKCLVEKGERFEKTFEAELAAVAHLRHRNLVRLRGWCAHDERLFLVYDYMPNRSLDRVLFRKTENSKVPMVVPPPPLPPPLSWERRRKIVRGLAAGLHYLHEQLETQIVHRDVKTSNVMLDSDFNARLGDFGLARWLEHELDLEYTHQQTSSNHQLSLRSHQFRLADTTRIGGTIGYLPPETFERGSVATSKSDVFSFGIVVLEVASGRRAVDLAYPDDRIVLLDWVRRLSDQRKLLEAGDSQLKDGSFVLSDMERVIQLGLLCTVQNPQSRPSMKWVIEALSGDIAGKLPALPSFQSHPQYISFSSDSNTSTTGSTTSSTSYSPTSRSNITIISSSQFLTANGDTIYATAHEYDEKENSTANSNSNFNSASKTSLVRRRRSTTFFTVETPREISYKELVLSTENFAESHRVAELDFGTAYRGLLQDCGGHHHYPILIKRLGMNKCPALRARFSDELRNLGRLRHRNLVQLRGWCTEFGEMLVVYDYSTTRLLSHLLIFHQQNNRVKHPVLKWHQRYDIIKSLASAILYLHEEWDEQVVHRNITSSAVVLDPDMNPRLSGFALAEFLTRNDHGHKAAAKKNKSVRGIFGYISPEYIESGEATPKADIYSFGVVILEVVTGEMAVDFRRKEVLLVRRVNEFEARMTELEDLVDLRLNGEYDHKEMVRLVKLGIACTRSNPELRPSIRQIVSILDGKGRHLKEISSEDMEDWKQSNATCLSMIRSMQALGIQ